MITVTDSWPNKSLVPIVIKYIELLTFLCPKFVNNIFVPSFTSTLLIFSTFTPKETDLKKITPACKVFYLNVYSIAFGPPSQSMK